MSHHAQPETVGMATCGSPSGSKYASGCRCYGCRFAHRNRMRNYYRSKGGNASRKPEVESARRAARRAQGFKREWTPERRAAYELREAQKAQRPCEKFTHIEIFDRDQWVCGICGDPVSPDLKYPNRLSASLDHILPLSLGGSHTRTNVRCSHLTCNLVRGNRIDAESLEDSTF